MPKFEQSDLRFSRQPSRQHLLQRAQCHNQTSPIWLPQDEKFCIRRQAPPKRHVEQYQEYDTNVEFAPLPASTDNKTLLDAITEPRSSDKLPQLTIVNVPDECSSAHCDFTNNQVCDTNNRTHVNVCFFKYHACLAKQSDVTIELAHMGACSKPSNVCISCPKEEDKISLCDNLNTTHYSLCMFIQFNCHLQALGEPERVLVHIKSCHSRSPQFSVTEEKCPNSCSKDWKPVCDEANNTHQNLCSFQKSNCNLRKLGVRAPLLRYLRACIKTPTLNFKPNGKNDTLHLNTVLVTNMLKRTHHKTEPVEEKTTVLISSYEYPIKKSEEKTTSLAESTTMSTTRKTMVAALTTTTTTTTTTGRVTTTTQRATTTTQKSTTQKSTTTQEPTEPDAFLCPKPNCPTDGQPVCDSNGNLHGNLCEFAHWRCLAAQKGEQLRIAAEESCVTTEACQLPCTDESHPICASDFNTYKNLCIFRKHKCLDNNLEVLFKGTCSECFGEPCSDHEDAPDESFVCMEDGTSKSLCEYQMLSCIFEKGYGVNITIQYLGRCCPGDDLCDIENPNAKCGSNGITYFSQCEIDVENCRNGKLDVPLVTVEKDGICDTQKPSIFVEKHFDEEAMIDLTTGTTFNCTEECSKVYEPVCGFNDVTYSNLCMMMKDECEKKNSIGVSYNGTCCHSECPNNFAPICDSDGDTHQNLCYFGLKRCILERTTSKELTIDKFDVCSIVLECDDDCPKEFTPICASNGETIVNECELNRINCLLRNNIMSGETLTKEYDGKCCSTKKCSFEFSPVCDSEGVTHANECILEKHACIEARIHGKKIELAYEGSCCPADCPKEYAPVCDGSRTHNNSCFFKKAQCEEERAGTILSMAYEGECCSLQIGQCALSGPICDSDGITHEDECLFLHQKCIAEKQLRSLEMVYMAECCIKKSCNGPESPICDNFGNTHKSSCHFENAKCTFDHHSTNHTLEIDYKGECCPGKCNDTIDIICDQHGQTYQNNCVFRRSACEAWARTRNILREHSCVR